jgi:hypothetical protein
MLNYLLPLSFRTIETAVRCYSAELRLVWELRCNFAVEIVVRFIHVEGMEATFGRKYQ